MASTLTQAKVRQYSKTLGGDEKGRYLLRVAAFFKWMVTKRGGDMASLDRSCADVGALLGGVPLKDSPYTWRDGKVMLKDSPDQKDREAGE